MFEPRTPKGISPPSPQATHRRPETSETSRDTRHEKTQQPQGIHAAATLMSPIQPAEPYSERDASLQSQNQAKPDGLDLSLTCLILEEQSVFREP